MLRLVVAKRRGRENTFMVLNVNTKNVFTYLRCPVGRGHLLEPKISSLGIFSNNNSASLIVSFLVWKCCSECIYLSIALLLLIDAQWNWSLRGIWASITSSALSYCCRFFCRTNGKNLNIYWEEKSAIITEGKILTHSGILCLYFGVQYSSQTT